MTAVLTQPAITPERTIVRPLAPPPSAMRKLPILKFRLLHGKHTGPHPEQLRAGIPPAECVSYEYQQGEIVYSDLDLTHYNGKAVDARKFERIIDEEPRFDPFKFDPAIETLEQFTERVRAMQSEHQVVQQDVPQINGSPPTNFQQAASPHSVPAQPAAGKIDPNTSMAGTVSLADELNGMTVLALQKYAEEEEVELKGAKDKNSIIRTILAAKEPKK